ncbi:transcription initiation factor TFIID subunit 10, putative [Plasmodium vivax]|uniref:Transcription initiation factor TFIID subunit 10 n=6 Tax=Plasmodium vivax TaxID=5855 RepID=A5K9D7_PLAVS|nr:hypothetical protein, conserved [Plasmodium vivax]KMZ80151.1 hypothetical protein PVIIG_01931 [Plasmodium vivax India VII]KMZ86237.1 hypothetical protein PVBG_01761 [Plasmodium vivax Brazil I]KMZ92597.1 hypothetical protein PVMG_01185 [Plasmodium vivax Mauritania I]KMZ99147.1 hypothetical protein PVNG_00837 [Plasmodium vivax North Korean]EDL44009.1 hypothetical protein, conserved [Plasmodium vivax]|eukprot:XP_001613736.1 hypothetical protein [Plasmodium vivax Sal-1]
MDDNFVSDKDEQLLKLLLKNRPTFSEELIDYYLSYSGCSVTEKSCLRFISLILHKSIDKLVDQSTVVLPSETPHGDDNQRDKESRGEAKKELSCKKLIEALKEFDQNYQSEEIVKNFNLLK